MSVEQQGRITTDLTMGMIALNTGAPNTMMAKKAAQHTRCFKWPQILGPKHSDTKVNGLNSAV